MQTPKLDEDNVNAANTAAAPPLMARPRVRLLADVASVYGVQFGNYVFPLFTVPYLSRVLGPSTWGLTAMAQAFGTYGHIIIEYGFAYSATRGLATATDPKEISDVVAGVSGARVLLSSLVLVLALIASVSVPLFREHPLLLWAAVISEIFKASLPNYYFYGIHRVTTASVLDVTAKTASLLGVFFLVKRPADAWIFFALQGAGAFIALIIAHWMIYRHYAMRKPRLRDSIRMLREGAAMFLFRSSHNLYVLGNAFVLGLFAPPQAVGYYAGAEKINSAAVNLISPLTTALYPRAASLAKNSLPKAARLTSLTLYATLGISACLILIMWFGAPLIIPVILGPQYAPSVSVLRILSLRAPFVAWSFVLGFQWLLPLELEVPFQKITLVALGVNLLLAMVLAPRFSYTGMAWTVVFSQVVAAAGIYLVLKRRGLMPFAMRTGSQYV